jgi:hypothetical protein
VPIEQGVDDHDEAECLLDRWLTDTEVSRCR